MRGSVLIVDDDEAVSHIVAEVLRDEGFFITELIDAQPALIETEIARLEPDVVLLDGSGPQGYGRAWSAAAWMHERQPSIQVIMFTAHAGDLAEAQRGVTQRSQRAAFAGYILKPFDVTLLVATVARVVDGRSSPTPEAAPGA